MDFHLNRFLNYLQDFRGPLLQPGAQKDVLELRAFAHLIVEKEPVWSM